MKTKINLLVAGMFLAATSSGLATVRYVNVNNASPTPPYTNWVTAATNIQDAVDAAGAGDEILVTNGTYAGGSRVGQYGVTNRVVVDKPLVLSSVNGPDVTVINGGGVVRCVYLTNNAVMVGFTLTNGSAVWSYSGGGVYCESTNAVLSNCVLSGNSGGGANGGTLNNCTLSGNWAPNGGGAAYATLNNCKLNGNSVFPTGGGGFGLYGGVGGGAFLSTLNNCTLTGNSAYCGVDKDSGFLFGGVGGGAYFCTLNNCTLTGNSTYLIGLIGRTVVGEGGGACDSTLKNCTLTGNSAGDGGGAENCTLTNCTLTGNTAQDDGGGAYSCSLNNCIVYFNSDPVDGGNYDPSSTLNYCCTTPMPPNGVGNISADPQLASASHLSALSPCIGAGSATYASGTDIDGEAWANPPSIGCDEYHAGAVTGPLTVSLTATLTNAVIGYPVGLTAFIAGRSDLSVWDFGDGYVQVNEPYTSHTWTAPGDYLVALWAFNDSYPEGVSATVTVHVEAGVHYVSATSGNPVAPYTNWATAATNIQDAVDAAVIGDEILVTNGVYAGGSQVDPDYGNPTCVVVNKPLVLSSVNGPDFTIINGGSAVRCIYLTNNAVIMGFTLTNGAIYGAPLFSSGGGAYCESTNAVLTNCVLAGNSADVGGGAYGGTLNNCTLTGNSAHDGGGAMCCALNNCTLTSNSVSPSRSPFGGFYGGWGGGAYISTLNNCTLTGNTANGFYVYDGFNLGLGGGADICTLNNCTLTGNSAYDGGGACDSTLNNCTLTGNTASNGYGGGASSQYWPCMLYNCTVVDNVASQDGGGVADSCFLTNCIVAYNAAWTDDNYTADSVLDHCCTEPLPANGVGNISVPPQFVDYAGGNLRLQSNSPCINSGDNAYVVGTTDLDGNPRIVGGTVDIGAYEYQTPTSIISYAWLQQYGLPTDGSADHADLDGTGMNVYQDWVAGLNPTNALSVLKMLPPAATNNPLGLVVSWQSVSNITYFLQRSTNLAAQPAFSTIQSNIVGQTGTTSYTDTTATNAGPYFYRVGVGN